MLRKPLFGLAKRQLPRTLGASFKNGIEIYFKVKYTHNME